VIDLHCHILPKTDDGAQSMAESLRMANIAVQDGIEAIVATPHIFPPDHQPLKSETISALRKKLAEHKIELTLYSGAEVYICSDLSDYIEKMPYITVNNMRKYILIEFPFMTFPMGAENEIFNLGLNGITPVICHPERNTAIQNDMEILYKLVSMGALAQITAHSITGDFGKTVKKTSEAMLRRRLIHIIASDAHSPGLRPPLLSDAVIRAAKILKNFDEAKRMVTETPARIIAGEPVDVPDCL